jgi:hypothetical protein
LFKIGLTILLAVLSCPLVLRLVKPGASVRNAALWLAIVPVLLTAAVSIPFSQPCQDFLEQKLALGCALLALRHGAPERPDLAEAAAGVFAGAIGAAFYATHCPDDSPLFVATWYSLAIGLVVVAGKLAGRQLLRW